MPFLGTSNYKSPSGSPNTFSFVLFKSFSVSHVMLESTIHFEFLLVQRVGPGQRAGFVHPCEAQLFQHHLLKDCPSSVGPPFHQLTSSNLLEPISGWSATCGLRAPP